MSTASAAQAPAPLRRGGEAHGRDLLRTGGLTRWAACGAVMIAVHAAVLAIALMPRSQPTEGFPLDAINIDLPPDVAEPSPTPDEVSGTVAPEPQTTPVEQSQTVDPEPPAPEAPDPTKAEVKPIEAPPEAVAPPSPEKAEVELPPETKPAEVPPETKATEVPPEPVKDPLEAKKEAQERLTIPSRASADAAALISGGRRASAAARATWGAELGRHLGRLRRYPVEARSRGLQGVAKLKVTIDAQGHVLGTTMVQSAGSPLLDSEARALVARADPFPKPPPGMPTPMVLNVPVVFSIR